MPCTCIFLLSVNTGIEVLKFSNKVFVTLQKPRPKYDIYNIRGIIEILKSRIQDASVGLKVALCLCLDGNDFIPMCNQVSHDSILKVFIHNQQYRDNLCQMSGAKVRINKDMIVDLFRFLFCPKKHQGSSITFDEVRALSISKTVDKSEKSGYRTCKPYTAPDRVPRNCW
ncbi:hypothetical protein DPMN_166706 [Dreissena polymorpha]|uniref:Uncharacterized protein n=1 Tax=Dreissena polymorpha TaxID=45954 RepID=A0A9D4F1Z2_DREPO|nr:hypothetical protein DPMN_166706 [Dreissena polymorpha]